MKEGGIITGQVPVFHWDGPGHDEMITRIVRGLYYRVFGRALPPTIPVRGSFQRPFEGDVLKDWLDWSGENIGKEGEFCYRYAFSSDDPNDSLWLIVFYARHFACGHTGFLVERKTG